MKTSLEDRLFSKYIRLKAGWRCEACGQYIGESNRNLHCAHFHGRKRLTTRWDEDNAASLCGGCHQDFDDHPDMKNDWFRKRLGSERFEELGIRARKTIKEIPLDRKELKADLKEKIRQLEG